MTPETRKMLETMNGNYAWTIYAVCLLAFFTFVAGAAALSLYQQHGPSISCRVL